MRKRWASMVLVAAAVAGLPVRAEAAAPPAAGATRLSPAARRGPEGLELGLRVGYGIPIGNAVGGGNTPGSSGARLSDILEGQVPIWVDVGYRLPVGVYLGGYAQIGPGITNGCSPPECVLFDLRIGGNALFHILPTRRIDPWVGLGLGYELLYTRAYTDVAGVRITNRLALHGFEFLNAQVGVDFRVTRDVAAGPFFTCALSQYRSADVTIANVEGSTSDFEKSVHLWLLFGVRGTFLVR